MTSQHTTLFCFYSIYDRKWAVSDSKSDDLIRNAVPVDTSKGNFPANAVDVLLSFRTMTEPWMYVPKPPLSQFVAFFWYCEAEATEWKKESCLPTGTVELVVVLSEPEAAPVLCGPHSRAFILEKQGAVTLIAMHFRPGGFFPFLRVSPQEIRNEKLSLRDIWGADADALRDRLLHANSLTARYRILEEALLERAAHGFERCPEVLFAMRELAKPRVSVANVTDQIGYSGRHFGEVFRHEVGLSPKSYARVMRFQQVILRVGGVGDADWADIANEAGYFDQAHFANDFREFSGLTPSQYLGLRTPHLNHVPIPD